MGSNLAFSVLTLRELGRLWDLRFWDQNSFAESVLELIGMEMEELGRSGSEAKWGMARLGDAMEMQQKFPENTCWKFSLISDEGSNL